MKKLFGMLALAAMMFMPFAANANQIYSQNYGNWELMAWDGNNRFCALKQYIGNKTFSIRMTSRNGITLVVYDPNASLRVGTAEADVSFDEEYYGSYTEETFSQWRNQAFIKIGHDPEFMARVIDATNIKIQSVDVNYHLNLIGTERLGTILYDCVRTYGF